MLAEPTRMGVLVKSEAWRMASDSRERMVRSAAVLLREHGYAGTGFRDVIAHSEAPWGSIYHHFPGGKAQLAEEAVRYAGDFVAQLIEHSPPDDPVASCAASSPSGERAWRRATSAPAVRSSRSRPRPRPTSPRSARPPPMPSPRGRERSPPPSAAPASRPPAPAASRRSPSPRSRARSSSAAPAAPPARSTTSAESWSWRSRTRYLRRNRPAAEAVGDCVASTATRGTP